MITTLSRSIIALSCAAACMVPTSAETLNESAKLFASDGAEDDRFGGDASISGDTVVVGAVLHDEAGTDSGSAYVFTRSDGVWSEQAKLIVSDGSAHDRFGQSVSISGDTALVGAPRARALRNRGIPFSWRIGDTEPLH